MERAVRQRSSTLEATARSEPSPGLFQNLFNVPPTGTPALLFARVAACNDNNDARRAVQV